VHQWNEIDRGKPTTRRKTCPSATLSTTNLTWTDPGSSPGVRGERPATNRLSHGTAFISFTASGNFFKFLPTTCCGARKQRNCGPIIDTALCSLCNTNQLNVCWNHWRTQ
jgi:hypothetical protein